MTSPISRGRILISVLILLALAAGVYWLRKPRVLSESVRWDPKLTGDFETLTHENSTTSPETIASALLRLSGVRAPEGKREALRRQRDPRPVIRRAVAEALAIIESDAEVIRAQEALLSDPDASVRFAALRGLAFSNDPGRTRLLMDKVLQSDAEPLEKLTAHAGLSRSGASEAIREHTASFRKYLEASIGQPFFADAIRVLVRLSPDDPGCIRVGERFFVSGQVPAPLLPELYLFLARRSPAFVSSRVMADVRSTVLPLRNAVIQSLSSLCPPDRWKVLQWVIEGSDSPDSIKRLAIQVAENLGVRVGSGLKVPSVTPKSDRCVSRR